MFTPPPLDQKSGNFPVFSDFPPAMSPPPLEDFSPPPLDDFSPDKEFSPPPMDDFSPGKSFSPPSFGDFSPTKDEDLEIGGYNGTLDLEEDDTKFQKILQLQPRELLEMKKESEQQTNFMEQRNNQTESKVKEEKETNGVLPPEVTELVPPPTVKDDSRIPEAGSPTRPAENSIDASPCYDHSTSTLENPQGDIGDDERTASPVLLHDKNKKIEISSESEGQKGESKEPSGDSGHDINRECLGQNNVDEKVDSNLESEFELSNNNNNGVSDVGNNFVTEDSGINKEEIRSSIKPGVRQEISAELDEVNGVTEDVNSNHLPELKQEEEGEALPQEEEDWGRGEAFTQENPGKTDLFADFDGDQVKADEDWGNFGDNPSVEKEVEQNSDEDDDFGDFDSAEPDSKEPTGVQLRSVIEKIGGELQDQIISAFSLPEEKGESTEAAVQPKLISLVEEDEDIWKQVEDPASTPGLEFSWAESCLYSILLNTLNIDTRVMLDGENWRNSIQRNHKSSSFSGGSGSGGILQPTTVDILKPVPVQADPKQTQPSDPAPSPTNLEGKPDDINSLSSNQVDLHSPDFDWSLPDQPVSDAVNTKGEGPDLSKSRTSPNWLTPTAQPLGSSTSTTTLGLANRPGMAGMARGSSPSVSPGASQILDAFPLLNFMSSQVLLHPTRSPFAKRRTK